MRSKRTDMSGVFRPLANLAKSAGAVALGGSAAWVLFSRFAVDREVPLPLAIRAERRTISTDQQGDISTYVDRSAEGRPLVLVHSLNAAASAFEVMPIFERYRSHRPVIALDLPGFGFSQRGDAAYTPERMSGAILQVLRDAQISLDAPADVVALSASCEATAHAAWTNPSLVRSLAFISPTGFSGRQRNVGPIRRSVSNAARALLDAPPVGQPVYDLIVSRPSIAYFLEKCFRGPADLAMKEYAYATSHQPGARYAPLAFLAGRLMTPGVRDAVYARLACPVAVLYDADPFTDFDALDSFMQEHRNWTEYWLDRTCGLPHFEQPEATWAALDRFWSKTEQIAGLEAGKQGRESERHA